MLDRANRQFAARKTSSNLSRAVEAVVVAVRRQNNGLGRPRSLYDVIEVESRTPILAAVTLSWEGRGWIDVASQLQPTTRNLVTGTVYSTSVTTRFGEMADGIEPQEGWDGDRVLVQFVGRQAVIVGCMRPAESSTDVAAGGITDPADPLYMEPGTTLTEAGFVAGVDELPVAPTGSYPDGQPHRWGRLFRMAWLQHGLAVEVRDDDAGTMRGYARTHAEATASRIFARSGTVRVEAGQHAGSPPLWTATNVIDATDGAGVVSTIERGQVDVVVGGVTSAGLLLSADAVSESDLGLTYMPVCRHNTTKAVIDLQAAQIAELQGQLNAAIAGLNKLQIEVAALKAATAVIQITPAGVLTNAVGAVPSTISPVAPVVAPPPTAAQITAMRSATVRAGA